jgi:broad specificity phosphatase PhoE
MVTIVFEPHATTLDNELGLASGWNDVPLSELGTSQAKDLGKRHRLSDFDAIFTSDLERAYRTAQLAFGPIGPRELHMDWRLRECNYGELTQQPKQLVDTQKLSRITTPFPGGESYEQTAERMRSFLQDLLKRYDGKTVLFIGHRATQYGLEHWVTGTALDVVVTAPWQWQPGWTYKLDKLQELSPVKAYE